MVRANGKRPAASIPACRPFRSRACESPVRSSLLDLSGLLDQAGHDPCLGLRNWPALGDLDHVAQLVFALFVMSVVLAGLRDDLAVQLVLGPTLDQDRDSLGALVADDFAHQCAGVLGLGFDLSSGHLLASFFFCARMVFARAMSRRVFPSCVWLVSCWVAFCMRKPKWALSRSATSFCRPATSLLRSSDAFICVLRVRLRAHLASHEGRLQRQLGRSQQERFTSEFFRNTIDFV